MHDPHDLVQRHLALFNQGVRSGDFGPMLDQFTDDAELIFYNIPVGPFQGKRAIAAAYQTQPPDDEMTARAVQADEGTSAPSMPGTRAGDARRDDDPHPGERADRPAGRLLRHHGRAAGRAYRLTTGLHHEGYEKGYIS